MYIRDIHGMCTDMDHYMWMIQEYCLLATLQILVGAFLFDSRPGHRQSWLIFSMNVLSYFWRMRDSSSISSRPLPPKAYFIYHILNMPLDTISFKLLKASLIKLYIFKGKILTDIVCLFLFLALQTIVVYCHSPVAGFSLVVFDVFWSHTTTRYSR
jgi:hypothetical protein